MVRAINKYLAEAPAKPKSVLEFAAGILEEGLEVLGLDFGSQALAPSATTVEKIVASLVEFRKKARQEKDYRTGDLVRDILNLQGITLEDSKETSRVKFESEPELEALMADVVELRNSLRKERNFIRADQLRDDLAELGIVLEDAHEGSRWRLKDC